MANMYSSNIRCRLKSRLSGGIWASVSLIVVGALGWHAIVERYNPRSVISGASARMKLTRMTVLIVWRVDVRIWRLLRCILWRRVVVLGGVGAARKGCSAVRLL